MAKKLTEKKEREGRGKTSTQNLSEESAKEGELLRRWLFGQFLSEDHEDCVWSTHTFMLQSAYETQREIESARRPNLDACETSTAVGYRLECCRQLCMGRRTGPALPTHSEAD